MSKNTKTTNAPKWGTAEWIAAHPWSEMDKDRKRRVRKFLGFDPDQAPKAYDIYKTVKRMLDKIGVKMTKDYVKRIEKTFADADKFVESSLNDIVAKLLSHKQGLETHARTCKKCSNNCTCHKGA